MKKQIIPVFLSYQNNSDEIISCINKINNQGAQINVLHKGIDEDCIEKIKNTTSLPCVFCDVSKYITSDNSDLFKFAIPMVTKNDKVIYIDANCGLDFDVDYLWNFQLGDYYAGAYHNSAFDTEVLSSYTERVLGIYHHVYTSDKILVLNNKLLRKTTAYERFLMYYNFCNFSVNASEALFNLMCKDNIRLLNGTLCFEADSDKAQAEIDSDSSFLAKWNAEKRAKDRVDIVNKIADFEQRGNFEEDVEDDVPGRMIMPDEIEYIKTKASDKLKAKIAFSMAKRFYYRLEKKRMVIVDDEIEGLENLSNLDTGAIITCNHFNAMDSFAMHLLYLKSKQRKRKLYRIIREGNYTSFPGFFGFLMRNFYTLPLSSNHKTMRKFMDATNTLLQDGNFVLIYPEQSMWWNYRKPKPLKPGGFNFAAKNNVPVLPVFITMRDSDVLGPDGYYVQKYKLHVSKPIYPTPELSTRENTEAMMKQNEALWREIYEREYQMPLEFTTEKFTIE